MQKAYIIIAHKNPDQLCRLIKTLTDGLSNFFIHIDKNVSISIFKSLEVFGNDVHFVERVFSKWSSYGLVQGTLNAMAAIKHSKKDFDRIILLSGQDYPIKSNNYINKYLHESPHSIFFEYWPLPNYNKWPKDKGGMYRINKYYFGLKFYQLFFSKLANLLASFFPLIRRKIPVNMKPFAGSQWWIIDKYTTGYILDFVNKHPVYTAFHKHTFASDELFFQMILLNSQDEKILNNIKNESNRFIKWKASSVAHPELLTEIDFDDISNSDKLFARKFDQSVDSKILDLIDSNCL